MSIYGDGPWGTYTDNMLTQMTGIVDYSNFQSVLGGMELDRQRQQKADEQRLAEAANFAHMERVERERAEKKYQERLREFNKNNVALNRFLEIAPLNIMQTRLQTLFSDAGKITMPQARQQMWESAADDLMSLYEQCQQAGNATGRRTMQIDGYISTVRKLVRDVIEEAREDVQFLDIFTKEVQQFVDNHLPQNPALYEAQLQQTQDYAERNKLFAAYADYLGEAVIHWQKTFPDGNRFAKRIAPAILGLKNGIEKLNANSAQETKSHEAKLDAEAFAAFKATVDAHKDDWRIVEGFAARLTETSSLPQRQEIFTSYIEFLSAWQKLLVGARDQVDRKSTLIEAHIEGAADNLKKVKEQAAAEAATIEQEKDAQSLCDFKIAVAYDEQAKVLDDLTAKLKKQHSIADRNVVQRDIAAILQQRSDKMQNAMSTWPRVTEDIRALQTRDVVAAMDAVTEQARLEKLETIYTAAFNKFYAQQKAGYLVQVPSYKTDFQALHQAETNWLAATPTEHAYHSAVLAQVDSGHRAIQSKIGRLEKYGPPQTLIDKMASKRQPTSKFGIAAADTVGTVARYLEIAVPIATSVAVVGGIAYWNFAAANDKDSVDRRYPPGNYVVVAKGVDFCAARNEVCDKIASLPPGVWVTVMEATKDNWAHGTVTFTDKTVRAGYLRSTTNGAPTIAPR